ncbi:ribonuclease III [Aurantiacibacter poecillastricola]|uniref:ribonuclease III n=1 Tax=Aurantiacibacter poecillastricola TaxID=3064385 RepID=UPI00273E8262|nr:ribonuclease III [Aurantiacibacter sp. 219JJ12-13]MDP5262240.1 ribonuclease III [Aurantiacibacter sp. 219JJ12-13]
MSALPPETRAWLEQSGFTVRDEALWAEALTHGSTGETKDYQRLEFLGDRVLGLSIAHWLYEISASAEGKLAQRLNALVSKRTCAGRAREIKAPDHVRMGKQAREDGAQDSENVLGDIMESLLGANFLEAGFEETQALIRELWQGVVGGSTGRQKHPKSALQEWAAGNQRRPPLYEVTGTSGPDHNRRFTVQVSVHNVGAVEATASGKREAETEAARLFMEKYG